MSDVPPTAQGQAPQSAPTPSKETSPLRLILLLLVFGVLLACLLYDRTIARPTFEKATKIVLDLLDEKMPDPNHDGGITQAEIQDLLGRAPTSVQQVENGLIELYSWRGGIPYRTYDLYVTYVGQQKPLLYSAWTSDEVENLKEEDKARRLPPKTVIPRQMTEQEKKDFQPRRPTGMGGPGAGGGGKKRDWTGKTPRGEGPAPGGGPGVRAKGLEPPTEPPKADEPAPVTEPDRPGPAEEPEPRPQPPAGDQPAEEEPAEPSAGEGQG